MERHIYLDGWRGLAIIGVIIGHMRLVPVLDWGTLGVELFFALSGRLMAELLFVRRVPLDLFLWRRFTRVWPALFLYVALMVLVSPFVPGLVAKPLTVGE